MDFLRVSCVGLVRSTAVWRYIGASHESASNPDFFLIVHIFLPYYFYFVKIWLMQLHTYSTTVAIINHHHYPESWAGLASPLPWPTWVPGQSNWGSVCLFVFFNRVMLFCFVFVTSWKWNGEKRNKKKMENGKPQKCGNELPCLARFGSKP